MSEPVRILHIVHTLNRGGMESRIMDIYRYLDHERFQYDFYVESGQAGMFDDEVISLRGRIYRCKSHIINSVPNFKEFHQFLLKHPEYMIIYAYNQWSGFYLKQAQKCCIDGRIANARTSVQTKTIKNSLKNILKVNVNRYATHRFAVSRKAAVWLFGEKITDRGMVKIWPNAIDTKKYRFQPETREEVRQELALGDAYTVLHVGNIRYEKNHPFLLRVFSEIKKKKENAKLVLIGGGDIDSLKPQMRELGITEDVLYLGVRQDIPRLLQAGDVFVFPSLYEGFPGAVLEAEASGLNCVISDSITEEVMLTDNIVALSLKDEPKKWADSTIAINDINRINAWSRIKETGFDIMEVVKMTEDFILSFFNHSSKK